LASEISPHAFEHKENLRKMRLNSEKCQIFKQELLYLGHRVTSERIGIHPEKVDARAFYSQPLSYTHIAASNVLLCFAL